MLEFLFYFIFSMYIYVHIVFFMVKKLKRNWWEIFRKREDKWVNEKEVNPNSWLQSRNFGGGGKNPWLVKHVRRSRQSGFTDHMLIVHCLLFAISWTRPFNIPSSIFFSFFISLINEGRYSEPSVIIGKWKLLSKIFFCFFCFKKKTYFTITK